MKDVIIVGGGLSGLSIAFYLKKSGIESNVLEAQDRFGGRIQTIYGKSNTPMEMGATWFQSHHRNLIDFLFELKIDYYKQHDDGISLFETMSSVPPQEYHIPPNASPAYRIKGGTSILIDKLSTLIGTENLFLNTEIVKVINKDNVIKLIDASETEYLSKIVIFAAPPKILINQIEFIPSLTNEVKKIMNNVQTWMSGSTKFSVEYKKPFWKERGFSGCVFSHTGLAVEIYDHTNFEETKFALKGFLNANATDFNYEERKPIVINQLVKYFGETARDFISYNDRVWNDKFTQLENEEFLPPHFNNGHSIFRDSYMEGKLFFACTETATEYGGYMDGSINVAKSIADKIGRKLAN